MRTKHITALPAQSPNNASQTNFAYIFHELLADGPRILGQSGAEHHHLLLMGRLEENLLDVVPHVWQVGAK